MFKKIFNIILIAAFISASLMPVPQAHAQGVADLPVPGTMIALSSAFEPVLIKGLKVHPENPFAFDFIVDTGNTKLKVSDPKLKEESNKLIKYFLAAMTVPEKDLWVNLSPYEKNRMIADNLGQTEMGRDMLAQDYILKQLTASLIYPEHNLGKSFWDKVYAKAQEMYGTTQIPVNTFNKVWIVADKADVFERGNVAYVVGAHLKVMLEEDYLALSHHQQNRSHTIASQVVREIVLPQLEQEVNTGSNFAPLRQMFYSIILASWYKQALKDALLTQVYGDQSKVRTGINAADPKEKDAIFQRYLQAYKKGVFNYIKDDLKADGQRIPRKYFSGGEDLRVIGSGLLHRVHEVTPAMISANGNLDVVSGPVSIIPASAAKQKKKDEPVLLNQAEMRAEAEKVVTAMLKTNKRYYLPRIPQRIYDDLFLESGHKPVDGTVYYESGFLNIVVLGGSLRLFGKEDLVNFLMAVWRRDSLPKDNFKVTLALLRGLREQADVKPKNIDTLSVSRIILALREDISEEQVQDDVGENGALSRGWKMIRLKKLQRLNTVTGNAKDSLLLELIDYLRSSYGIEASFWTHKRDEGRYWALGWQGVEEEKITRVLEKASEWMELKSRSAAMISPKDIKEISAVMVSKGKDELPYEMSADLFTPTQLSDLKQYQRPGLTVVVGKINLVLTKQREPRRFFVLKDREFAEIMLKAPDPRKSQAIFGELRRKLDAGAQAGAASAQKPPAVTGSPSPEMPENPSSNSAMTTNVYTGPDGKVVVDFMGADGKKESHSGIETWAAIDALVRHVQSSEMDRVEIIFPLKLKVQPIVAVLLRSCSLVEGKNWDWIYHEVTGVIGVDINKAAFENKLKILKALEARINKAQDRAELKEKEQGELSGKAELYVSTVDQDIEKAGLSPRAVIAFLWRDVTDVKQLTEACKEFLMTRFPRQAVDEIVHRGLHLQDEQWATPGGIDMSRFKTGIFKEGHGVHMQFDPSLLARIKRDGFDGMAFMLESIVPLTDLPAFLGLK